MIQFNLLPDVKLEYIKAQRVSRLIFSVSILVSAAALALLLLLLSIDGLQKKHLSDLDKEIHAQSVKLQSEPQINKILTVQNQLESLTALHNQKPAVSNLFDYLNQLTPNQVSINSLHVDFVGHTATIMGTADALSTVNKFVDTLKFTTYTASQGNGEGNSGAAGKTTASTCNSDSLPSNSNSAPAFSNVVLSNFALNSSNTSGSQAQAAAANYEITFAYDPNIFDITKTVKLSVPNLITTRSCLDKPNDLFTQAPPATTANGGSQ